MAVRRSDRRAGTRVAHSPGHLPITTVPATARQAGVKAAHRSRKEPVKIRADGHGAPTGRRSIESRMRVLLLKRWLVGPPMPLAQARHERLRKRIALAVFSSDALSSVAYATEEILLVLMLAGAVAVAPRGADRAGDHRAAGHRRHLLPPDDPRLSERRRLLHRRPRQPRDGARAWWRRRRCWSTTCSRWPCQRGGRRGRDHLGRSRAARRTRSRSASCCVAAHRPGQPARRARVGPHLRVPTYFFIAQLRLLLVGSGAWRLLTGSLPPAPPRARRRRTEPLTLRSSSCAPSPRAARR